MESSLLHAYGTVEHVGLTDCHFKSCNINEIRYKTDLITVSTKESIIKSSRVSQYTTGGRE